MPETADWNILLIGGSSCAGKTTLAEALAKHYDARYIDLDLFWMVLESRGTGRRRTRPAAVQ